MKLFITSLLILSWATSSCRGCAGEPVVALDPGESITFESPDYPAEYTGGRNCIFSFTSIASTPLTLHCESITIRQIRPNCRRNRFRIFETDERLCDLNDATLTRTVGDTLTVKLRRPRGKSETYGKFSCTVTAQCICHSTTSRIVGGTEATQGEYPFQVAVDAAGDFCGATIINAKTLLTTANCVDGLTASDITPRVGAFMSSGDGTTVVVEEIIQHSSFTGLVGGNDVALLILTEQLDLSDPLITPVCLSSSIDPDTDFTSSTPITIIGWGSTMLRDGPLATNLMESDVLYSTRSACEASLGGIIGTAPASIICTTSAGSSSGICGGDAGGPALFVQDGVYYEIGVASFFITDGVDCVTSFPSAFANVFNLYSWIEMNAEGPLCAAPTSG